MASTLRSEIIYSDFRTDFLPHPVKEDLVLQTNELSIISSIKNLIYTGPYERFHAPEMYGGIRTLLFEDISITTEYLIRNKIRETIENYEPRARILEIYVSAMPDDNAYGVTIVFSIINKQESITISFLLNRIR